MARPNQPWSSNYPTSLDTIETEMPTLVNDSYPGAGDGHRALAEHFHALRTAVLAHEELVGSDALESGSLRERSAAHDVGGGQMVSGVLADLANRDPDDVGPVTRIPGKTTPGDGGYADFVQCARTTQDGERYFNSKNPAYSWMLVGVEPGQRRWAGPGGNDLNSGLSYDERKQTFYGAFDSVATPGGSGTLYLLNGCRIGGEHAGDGQGIQLMSPFDPNYYSQGYPGYSGSDKTSAGWRMTKVINCFGVGGAHAIMVPEPVAYLLPGTADDDPYVCTDPQYAGLWIAGGSDMMMRWKSLCWAYWYRPARLGIDSNRGTSWSWVAKNKYEDCAFICYHTGFPGGTGGSFTAADGNVTFVNNSYTFSDECVGKLFSVAGAAAGNNGYFVIVTRNSDHSITYVNATGVTESPPACTFSEWILPEGCGPAIECGQLFWDYFRHCYMAAPGLNGHSCEDGPESAHLTALEAGASFLGRGDSMPGSSCWIEHCISSQGGIIYDCGAASWGLQVKDFCVEGYYVNDLPSLVVLRGVNIYGKVRLETIFGADAGVSYGVEIEGNDASPPVCLEVHDCGEIKGPYVALDLTPYYYGMRINPAIYRGTTGFMQGRVIGRHDGVPRAGGTVIARHANLAAASPTLGTSLTSADGIDDPWGGTSAKRLTNAAGVTRYATFRQAAITGAVAGDHVLFACWIRTSGAAYLSANGDLYGATSSLRGAEGGYWGSDRNPYPGDGEWRWQVVPLTYLVASTNPTLQCTIAVAAGGVVDYVGAVVNVILASEMTENEFAEYAQHMAQTPPGAVAGTAYGPPGVSQVIDGDSTVNEDQYVLGDADVAGNARTHGDEEINANLLVDGDAEICGRIYAVSDPTKFFFYPDMTDEGVCTWTIVPTPCPSTDEELVAQGWPSMEIGVGGVTDSELWPCDEEQAGTTDFPNLVGRVNGYEFVPYTAAGEPLYHQDFMEGIPHARKFCVEQDADTRYFRIASTFGNLLVGTQDFSLSILIQGSQLKSHIFWSRGGCIGGASGWHLSAMAQNSPIGLTLYDGVLQTGYSHNSNVIPAEDDTPYLITAACDRNGLTSFYINRYPTSSVASQIPGDISNATGGWNVMTLMGAQAWSYYSMIGKCAWAAIWIGVAIDRTGHDNLARALRL